MPSSSAPTDAPVSVAADESEGVAALPPGTSLEEYVRRLGGSHVIRRVLIANNGVGAVKAIRSMRHWSYNTLGNEREVRRRLLRGGDAGSESCARAAGRRGGGAAARARASPWLGSARLRGGGGSVARACRGPLTPPAPRACPALVGWAWAG